MDLIHKIQYKIGDTKTRSVTLFPARAQVFREIRDIDLKPGLNQVTISGLSPTLDEDSVKVEGTGAAIITDIAVEKLPNRDIFEEVYPDDDDTEHESDEEDTRAKESPQLQAAKDRLIAASERLTRADEDVASAVKRLAILDTFSKPYSDKDRPDISELLQKYKTERETAFEDHIAGAATQRKIQSEVDDASDALQRLKRVDAEAKQKERRKKEKARLQRRRRREERTKEKLRVRKEREQFWPRYCYSVTITLDVNPMTPMTSRRQSISSDVEVHRPASAEILADDDATVTERVGCDLVLSYVTSAASWTPSYDLQLSTTNGTATLCFDAQLRNATSETWGACKISLSTSDTTFAGIDSRIPTLLPWRVRLVNKANQAFGSESHNIAHSRAEIEQQQKYISERKTRVNVQMPRHLMFGVPQARGGGFGGSGQGGGLFGQAPSTAQSAFGQASSTAQGVNQQPNQVSGGLFGQAPSTSQSAFGQASCTAQGANQQPNPASGGLFGIAAATTSTARQRRSDAQPSEEPVLPPPPAAPAAAADMKAMMTRLDALKSYEGPPPTEQPDAVDFEDSSIEESGLTTSYDLPGLKTLAPRTGTSKQRVARIAFSNVSLSHTVVAKYRPVAYLKAKLKNSSKLTLLEGSAGLTLDGSFMGRTHIPRCSPGDLFTLSLGVDPAIKVSYPKPEVRRATTGLFTKENSSVFARAVVLHNTRAAAGKPAQLLVLDQVPVSEDERLRVDLVTPSGLTVSGGSVPTGAPGREEADRDRDWGRALATLKKGGEVNWDVKLNAGKVVKLWLEYSVSMPSSDAATECFGG